MRDLSDTPHFFLVFSFSSFLFLPLIAWILGNYDSIQLHIYKGWISLNDRPCSLVFDLDSIRKTETQKMVLLNIEQNKQGSKFPLCFLPVFFYSVSMCVSSRSQQAVTDYLFTYYHLLPRLDGSLEWLTFLVYWSTLRGFCFIPRSSTYSVSSPTYSEERPFDGLWHVISNNSAVFLHLPQETFVFTGIYRSTISPESLPKPEVILITDGNRQPNRWNNKRCCWLRCTISTESLSNQKAPFKCPITGAKFRKSEGRQID